MIEYEFLLQSYKILKYMNFPILLTELNAPSGYAVRFLYRFDFPESCNININYCRQIWFYFRVRKRHKEIC